MGHSVLYRLLDDDLQAGACPYASASALYEFLTRRPEVKEVALARSRGATTEEAISEFGESLLKELTKGVLFQHDITFAALAVALASRPTKFADRFLRDLGEVDIAEMPLSPRVARFVQERRFTLASNQSSVEGAGPPPEQVAMTCDDLAARYPVQTETVVESRTVMEA
jgi:hypothetical protein